jgi:hypothetical protein
MSQISLTNIRKDLLNMLRNADVLTITVRGVTTKTDSFTATASQTQFTLTNTIVRNIRSLTVASVSKKYITEYTFNENTGVVTLATGASAGNAVVIQYDYSTAGNEKIYPDLAREDLTLDSYPRIGMQLTSMPTKPFSLGGTSNISEAIVTIFCWVPVNKVTAVASGFGGQTDLTDLMSSIRTAIFNNKKSLATIPYMYPRNLNPITKSINNKIIQCSVDTPLRFLVET